MDILNNSKVESIKNNDKPLKQININKNTVQKPFITEDINNNNKIDTLKNVNTGNIEEMKLKRWNIIIIRQYLNTFKTELQSIYGKNLKEFEKKLFLLDNNKLLITGILENITVELNLKKNSDIYKSG